MYAIEKILSEHFQLSHLEENLVGQGRLELPTSPLSGVRSNQLSYRPKLFIGSSEPKPNLQG